MENNLSELEKIGFENVGNWYLNDGSIMFILNSHANQKNILYAFVVDGVIKYIGKSILTLRRRIYAYQHFGPTQKTNIRVHGLLKEMLIKNKSISIYAFVTKNPMLYKGVPIDLAAGLEDSLIAKFKPEWNIRK